MCEFLFTSYRQQHFCPWHRASCSKPVWDQPPEPPLGHCPTTSSTHRAPVMLLSPSGIAVYVSPCHWRIRDLLSTITISCCPWGSPGIFFPDPWPSDFPLRSIKGCSYCYSHHVFCSTVQGNVQCCMKGEQMIIEAEHEFVLRSPGT